ncbi:MAG: hypothetical protein J6A75_13040 [Lachnospiraceae bacterium]|nr:hypothetical protein [Lachnospiraceae bacterium]
MRKRIEELARGRYDSNKPVIEFSTDRIEMEIIAGREYTGEFVITSKNQIPIKGVVSSSNPRMECLTPRFEGNEVQIQYEFHSNGLTEGDIQKGEFCIICNQGEYSLSFVAVISGLYADSSVGQITNLHDFTRLAQKNWNEAKRIFYSPCFLKLLKKNEMTERLLYHGIAKGVPADQSMEEFLLAAKQKSGVEIQPEEENYTYYHVQEDVCKKLSLHKNTWGYIQMEVSSDSAFIEPEKSVITTEDFLGSTVEVGYCLHPEKMHAGKNFGCLILKNIHQEIVIRICATRENEGAVKDETRCKTKKMHIELMDLYVQYRLKKLVTGKWATESCRILEELYICNPENIWYRLMKAQAFVLNGQRQEAEWILHEFKRKCRDKKSPEWGYYLYICTLMEKEELCINRMVEEVEQIYMEHRENTMLFWCMLFLREEYVDNRHRKLKAIENRINWGVESPLLYVEAYCMFMQEPYLLNKLEDFELKVLNWARKQKLLNTALAEQLFAIFSERMEYQRKVLLLLEACYEQCSSEQILGSICGYLIKNQKYGRRFFAWYEKGIEAKLRITGLYEAYLMSMDSRSIKEVPKIILMYFKYNNQLGYKQKALLYVNIIAAKEKQPEVYEQYKASMESFAYEQMERGRIDDNLAVIYEEVVSKGVYSTELAEALTNVLFVHKLTCFAKEAARVIVVQKQLNKPQIVPLVNGIAYFSLYSNDYCIFVEDCYGNRYGGSVSYQLEKLMYPGKYLRACMQYAPHKTSCLLYYFANREAQEYFEEKDLEHFKQVMSDSSVSRMYQTMLCPKFFRLLRQMGLSSEMEKEVERIDAALLLPEERSFLVNVLIEQKIYDKAYHLAEEYGMELIDSSKRLPILTDRIQRIDFTEDEILVKCCEEALRMNQFNEVLLTYLCKYYRGSLKRMTAIWKQSVSYEIDTLELEERMIEQILYTEEFSDLTGEIYSSYEDRGNALLKEAYLTYFSNRSFCYQEIAPEHFSDHLRKWKIEQKQMNSICELMLLKYYAQSPALLEKDMPIAEEILKKYLSLGIYFKFYKKLGNSLLLKYQLYDKYYIEYHTQPDRRILLHYKVCDTDVQFHVEEMTEMQAGIFVKEIVLFFDEVVQYYISEEDSEGNIETTESGVITCKEISKGENKSRYEALNAMRMAQIAGDKEAFMAEMERYQYLQNETKKLFTIMK